MKIEIKANGKVLELSKKRIEAIKKVVNVKEDFEPEYGDEYFYIDSSSSIVNDTWDDHDIDKDRLKCNNVFFTEEEAQKEVSKRIALQSIKKFIWENDLSFKPYWSDRNQKKYYVFGYDIKKDKFTYDYNYLFKRISILPNLKSEKDTQKVIDNCEKELKILFEVE